MKTRPTTKLALLVLAVCVTMVAVQATWAQGTFDWTRNFGQVSRLYPTTGRTFFQLEGGETAMNPTNGYYFIPTTHNNYAALIELLYKAAQFGWTLHARTQQALDPNGFAEVLYLVVDEF
jgi:hypothetical protein